MLPLLLIFVPKPLAANHPYDPKHQSSNLRQDDRILGMFILSILFEKIST